MFYNKMPTDPTSAAIIAGLCYSLGGLCFLIGWSTATCFFGLLMIATGVHFFLTSVIWQICSKEKAFFAEMGLEIALGALFMYLLFLANCLTLLALSAIIAVGHIVAFISLAVSKNSVKATAVTGDVDNTPAPPTNAPSALASSAPTQSQKVVLEQDTKQESDRSESTSRRSTATRL